MVQYVVVETVGGQHIALVVALVERPVVAQTLGCQNEHAVIAQLVIFDDRQCLEGLAQTYELQSLPGPLDGSANATEPYHCYDNYYYHNSTLLYSFVMV